MLGEGLRAPAIVDDREGAVRLTPVVDVLAVVRDHVTVTRSVGAQEAAVVELEPVAASGGTGDDLDLLPVETSVSEQVTHHFQIRRSLAIGSVRYALM